MDDAKIITLFWNRDERAIAEFSASHKRLCVAAANEITGSAHDAEECFADTTLAVWNSIPPENPKPFSSFLYKILRNLSRFYWKTEKLYRHARFFLTKRQKRITLLTYVPMGKSALGNEIRLPGIK